MATAKIVTWSRADKNAQFPIGIKISQNGIPAYLFEGNAVASRDHWDANKQQVKKAHPHHIRLTIFLTKRPAEINEKILEFETAKQKYAAEDIIEAIKPKQLKEEPTAAVPPAPKLPLFKEVADNYLNEQQGLGNYDVYKSDKSRLKRFYEFAGSEVTFPEITVEFLRRYTLFLRMNVNRNGKEQKPLSDRTVTNHLVVIRTMYNRAKTAGLVGNETYPFGGKDKINIKWIKHTKMTLSGQIKKVPFAS